MFKKLISLCLISIMSFGMSATAFATTNPPLEEKGEVVQIMFFDENGKQHIYRGQEAIAIHKSINNVQESGLDKIMSDVYERPENGIQTRGAFSYKYRFITLKSGTRYGPTVRITNYMANETSTMQRRDISAVASINWTINTNLTGMFKSAFESSIGTSWTKGSSLSDTFSFNIPPHKKVWLEFTPKLRYVEGESQKYFIPRGPGPKPIIIQERKKVSSTSPKTVNITINEKTVKAPDGVYTWKQSNR